MAHLPTPHTVEVLKSLKSNKAFPSQRAFQEKSQTQDISSVPV